MTGISGHRRQWLKEAGPHLSAGIVSGDLLHVADELSRLEEGGAALVHVDVTDGLFCPGISVGEAFLRALATPLLRDVHLLVSNPVDHIPWAVAAGADIVTFNLEATQHVQGALDMVSRAAADAGRPGEVLRGVALNPGTHTSALGPIIDVVDVVLILAIDPGFRSSPDPRRVTSRLREVQAMARGAGASPLLSIDGGVTHANAGELLAAGGHMIVSGSAVCGGADTLADTTAMAGILHRLRDDQSHL